MPTPPPTRALLRWTPFVLLLLVLASRWLLLAARPSTESTLASQALGCAWAALCWLTLNSRTSKRSPSPNSVARPLLAGALLFAGPAIGALLQTPYLPASGTTLALTLTSIVIAIALAALTHQPTEGISGQLWPGIAAVSGLLLLLAQPSLTNPRIDLALVLAPILTGLGAALYSTLPPQRHLAPIALTGGALTFLLGATADYATHRLAPTPTLSLSAIACDGLIALLSLTVLTHLGPTRWSAQFVLAPLLILLEGLILTRPTLDARSLIGLALLLIAGIYLLLPPSADSNQPQLTTNN